MRERPTNATDVVRQNFWFLPLLILITGLLLFALTRVQDYQPVGYRACS